MYFTVISDKVSSNKEKNIMIHIAFHRKQEKYSKQEKTR